MTSRRTWRRTPPARAAVPQMTTRPGTQVTPSAGGSASGQQRSRKPRSRSRPPRSPRKWTLTHNLFTTAWIAQRKNGTAKKEKNEEQNDLLVQSRLTQTNRAAIFDGGLQEQFLSEEGIRQKWVALSVYEARSGDCMCPDCLLPPFFFLAVGLA